MKLNNSTEFSDAFLRRMVAWVAKKLGHPVRDIKRADFGNRSTSYYNGRAFYYTSRILVRVGPAKYFPLRPDTRPGMSGESYSDRLEAFVAVTAHEIAHLAQWKMRRTKRLRAKRRTEFDARWHEVRVLRLFRADRDELLPAWSIERAKPAKPDVQQRRAIAAADKLAKWQRKAKLAATKIKQYKRRVKYYERALAAKRASGGA